MSDLLSQIIQGLIRTLIVAFGAWAATGGVTLTGTQLDQLTGSAMILVGAGWSVGQKWWAERAKRTAEVSAAVASVEHGTPVTVTVTPVGQDNIATRVSAAEQAAAPAVPLDVSPKPPPPPY